MKGQQRGKEEEGGGSEERVHNTRYKGKAKEREGRRGRAKEKGKKKKEALLLTGWVGHTTNKQTNSNNLNNQIGMRDDEG